MEDIENKLELRTPVTPTTCYETPSWPKISIVTPSYNQGQFIEETILSILNQKYPNLEFIIIDGGSTDNTIDIIKKYADQISHWVSEKDHGQADAINKGLERCTGEIFNWINSDDLLAERALFKLANIWKEHKFDIIAGSCVNFRTDTSEIISTHHNSKLSLSELLGCNDDFHQPGLWFSLHFLQRNKLRIDSSYHYSFDRIWLMSMLRDLTPKIVYFKVELALFRIHEKSKTTSNWISAEIELIRFLETFSIEDNAGLERKKRLLIRKLKCQVVTRQLFFGSSNRVFALPMLDAVGKYPFLIFNRFFWGAVKARIMA